MAKKKKSKSSALKEKMRQQQAENVKNRNSSSVGKGILNFSKIDADEIPYFKPRKGTNEIDIIPFWVKTQNHPEKKSVKRGFDFR